MEFVYIVYMPELNLLSCNYSPQIHLKLLVRSLCVRANVRGKLITILTFCFYLLTFLNDTMQYKISYDKI